MEAKLETKLKQLFITSERTNAVLETNEEIVIQRQLEALKALSTDAENCRRAVEAQKIAGDEEEIEIDNWNRQIEAKLAKADNEVKRLQKWQNDCNQEKERIKREEQIKFEVKLHETKLNLQSQLQMTTAENQPSATETAKGIQAKLPKLIITKFNGTFMDWPRFWGQFVETIENSSLPGVTKFSYLRELLDSTVKRDVEALPFTSEGYNRAKAILLEKYGKESEIVKAYGKEILDLPYISSANPRKIKEFCEKLTYCVQSLESLKKLHEVKGLTTMTIDKLPAIRGDLVRTDVDWELWDLCQLSEALRLWMRRNPAVDTARPDRESEQPTKRRERPAKMYHTRRDDYKPRVCVYCDGSDHKAIECARVTAVSDRKQILMKKKLCFNCALGSHRAAQCQSKTSCRRCDKRHHTSICDKDEKSANVALGMTANAVGEGVFPVVLVKVNGITTRALIDTGAGSSYVSAKVIDMMHKKPSEVTTKRVEMLMGSHVVKLESYDAVVESMDSKFQMDVKLTKVNKGQLLSIDNPHYEEMKQRYPHLRGVHVLDNDGKEHLPIHVILGVGDYTKIKTDEKPLIGKVGEPIAEYTKMGWFIMSPGRELDRYTMLLTQTSQADYEELCRLDVLGLKDSPEHDQQVVHDEFKEQLKRSPEGWYETGLLWRGNHPHLPSNEAGSLRRLNGLTKKLQRIGRTEEYDAIIRDQVQEGIVEIAPGEPKNKEFYIPHKCVIKETAETTKMRIVYDASARANPDAPSLNECLYPGPPLQNKLWDVLVQQRAYPVMISGDIRKAFLQIRIRESERDALRFHWRKDEHSVVETLRFTRALFGLAPSPFLLQGVIRSHLDAWAGRHPDEVAHLRRNMYVDDILTGGNTVQQAQTRKAAAKKILGDATFELHKWNSNIPHLETDDPLEDTEDQSYAKQQLQVKPSESRALGLKWNKHTDTLAVTFPTDDTPTTKRGVLSKLAKIYDPLGLVSPLILEGKLIYRDVCDAKTPWDANLNKNHLQRWQNWERSLPTEEHIPRSIVAHQENVKSIELHAFGDASTQGVGAAVYAVVRQHSGTTQRLVTAKSRLAKQGLTVPRLELVAAHMATNLLVNVCAALPDVPVLSSYAWLDSMVALHWICGNGGYKQFVANRVAKIQAHPEIQWRHVPTKENPADLASRGGPVTSSDLWWNGPEWLQDPAEWPPNPVTQTSPAAEAEAKVIREVLCVAKAESALDPFDELLERTNLRRALRACAWIKRFIHNSRTQEKTCGPLVTEEVEAVVEWWIQREQHRDRSEPHYPQTSASLNLQVNERGIAVCRGRIQGSHPIYLPRNAVFTKKLVQRIHCETLHGGVGLTMAAVREKYWIPKLRSLVKAVRKACWGCKRFRTRAVTSPVPGFLPEDRTKPGTAFEVIGVDFAGPLRYKKSSKVEGKAYLTIFACSLSRAVHLELLHNLETATFIVCFKKLIARRGRPRVIYSDNGSTFVKADKWLRQLRNDEQVQGFMEDHAVTWKFNLSRAPWWGGQFERLIGVVKSAMYKVIGGASLTWNELSEVLLDVEVQINRRPLSYLESDVELATLTPATFLFQRTNQLPEEEPWRILEQDLRKRAKYLKACKDSLWRRWNREYLTALRERHNLAHKESTFQPKPGDAMLVKADNKNRGKWPLAIVQEVYPGKDGVVRAVRLKTSKGTLERPVQHLYPLELTCDVAPTVQLNHEAPPFTPRPRRDAAAAASLRVQQIADMEW